MSTYYECLEKPALTFEELKVKLATASNYVRYHKVKDEDKGSFCITNGDVYLWVYKQDNERGMSFARFGGNYAVGKTIIPVLEELLKTELIDEHDERYREIVEDNANIIAIEFD